jgi:hypothetical protein
VIGTKGASAAGGAIEDDGDVKGASATIDGCIFTGNLAIGSDGGVIDKQNSNVGSGIGGAITSSGAGNTLTVTNSAFTGNQAIAGNGGSGGEGGGTYIVDTGVGGAIISFNSAILVVDHSNFSGNQAIAGSNAVSGASGQGLIGHAFGGALFNLSTATVTNSTFNNNLAQGGSGNTDLNSDLLVGAGTGGAIANNPFFDGTGGILTVGTCNFINNQASGGSGNSGGPLSSDGIGGALANRSGAMAIITSSTFTGNQALGRAEGAGSDGTDGLGGAIANILGSTLTISGCTLNGNQAIGGAGGSGANGGNGFGGGLYNDGTSSLTVTGSTITANSTSGGAAGSGGSAGQGIGGGCYFATGGTVCLDSFTVANISGNTVFSSDNNVFGVFIIC